MTNSSEVSQFYDEFSSKLLQDYIEGNARVSAIKSFLKDSISPNTKSILEIGCGTGDIANFLANSIARKSQVVALDISEKNVQIALALFSSDRIQFIAADVLRSSLPNGVFEVILFPDVYEHVPIVDRETLHHKIASLLGERGKIVLTVPSPLHQDSLRKKQEGLQIVDETVTVHDLQQFATDVGAELTYFSMISVWHSNDYIHAIIERLPKTLSPKSSADFVPIKRHIEKPKFLSKIYSKTRKLLGIEEYQASRKRRVKKGLGCSWL